MKICRIIPMSIPPTVLAPSVEFPLAPTPLANISGRSPTIIASEVIKIGRRRATAPRIALHVIDIPVRRRSRANSTMRMAFFAKRPMSMIRAICI